MPSSTFGPSDQQRLSDDLQLYQNHSALPNTDGMSREQLVAALESETMKNDKLLADIKELREEKVRLSLVLEEEDERRANMFLKKMEELENSTQACPQCALVYGKTHPIIHSVKSMSSLPE